MYSPARIREDLNLDDYIFVKVYVEFDSTMAFTDALGKMIADSTVGLSFRIEDFCGDIDRAKLVSNIEQSEGKIALPYEWVEETHGCSKGVAEIAIPADNFNFTQGGISTLLSSICHAATLRFVRRIRILDINLPKRVLGCFAGPRVGLDGIRKLIDLRDEPAFGVILKPRIGLAPSIVAKTLVTILQAGANYVADDELLSDPKICPRVERLKAFFKLATERDLDRYLYFVNVTGFEPLLFGKKVFPEADALLSLIHKHHEHLGIMVNPIWGGFDVIRLLVEQGIGVPILMHRQGHGFITREQETSISMYVLAKIGRLCGGDAIYVGTPHRMGIHALTEETRSVYANWKVLTSPMLVEPSRIERSLAVMSGGISPTNIEMILRKLESLDGKRVTDIALQTGGAVFSHDLGVKEGVKAIKTALNAYVQGKSLASILSQKDESTSAIRNWLKKHPIPEEWILEKADRTTSE